MPIIFFNIGWMASYQGVTRLDRITGNFAHIKAHGTGDEQYNFKPLDGYLYGYVPIKWDEETHEPTAINLERLGTNPGAKSIRNLTVVYFSRSKMAQEAYEECRPRKKLGRLAAVRLPGAASNFARRLPGSAICAKRRPAEGEKPPSEPLPAIHLARSAAAEPQVRRAQAPPRWD